MNADPDRERERIDREDDEAALRRERAERREDYTPTRDGVPITIEDFEVLTDSDRLRVEAMEAVLRRRMPALRDRTVRGMALELLAAADTGI